MRALQFVATLAAALFAGAALYINIAEHPARMTLDTLTAASQWAPSYKRATWLQAPLAAISCLCGAAVWWLDGGTGWLVAALLIGAVVPFTLIIIMPTNKRLLAPGETSRQPRHATCWDDGRASMPFAPFSACWLPVCS